MNLRLYVCMCVCLCTLLPNRLLVVLHPLKMESPVDHRARRFESEQMRQKRLAAERRKKQEHRRNETEEERHHRLFRDRLRQRRCRKNKAIKQLMHNLSREPQYRGLINLVPKKDHHRVSQPDKGMCLGGCVCVWYQ